MWNASWRNTEIDLKRELIAQITKKKKKHAMPREGCRHSRKIIKTGKFTRLSDSEETDEIFLTRPQHRFGWIARILSPAQHLCWKQAKLYLQPLLFWLKSYSWKCPKNSNTHKSVSLISPSGGMNMLLPPHPTPHPPIILLLAHWHSSSQRCSSDWTDWVWF